MLVVTCVFFFFLPGCSSYPPLCFCPFPFLYRCLMSENGSRNQRIHYPWIQRSYNPTLGLSDSAFQPHLLRVNAILYTTIHDITPYAESHRAQHCLGSQCYHLTDIIPPFHWVTCLMKRLAGYIVDIHTWSTCRKLLWSQLGTPLCSVFTRQNSNIISEVCM